MLLNDCRMRSRFDEKWSTAIGWVITANHFFIPLFLVSVLVFRVNDLEKSFARFSKRGLE